MYDFVFMEHGRVGIALSLVVLAGGTGTPSARAQEADFAAPTNPLRPKVMLETAALQGRHFVASLENGGVAQLTLHPALQKAVEEALSAHHHPFAAAAVISIPDGRVLALAGYSKVDPTLDAATLALRPWAPAASVFKVVSAAALLQEGHVEPDVRVCYHAGVSSVLRDNLIDMPAIDHSCASLGYGLGKSQNAIIAKLATKYLRPEQLERTAFAFGFGQELDFDAALEPSEVEIPREPLEFARAAAGFWHSSLSPLHGALLAATIANRGEMPGAHLIEKAIDENGARITTKRPAARRVLDPSVAEQVGKMMQLTTSMGTAKHSFRDRQGHPYLPVEVAGKTGTLFYRGRPQDPSLPSSNANNLHGNPGRVPMPSRDASLPAKLAGSARVEGGQIGYSWFVGFAPADHPTMAFAVLLGNPAASQVKAHSVARHLVAEYLAVENPTVRHGRMLARR
jgi:cell division protein FtsI/penicillin-binding protein 2